MRRLAAFGEDVLGHVNGEPGFQLIKADVRDIDGSVFDGVDAVVDLASISNDPAGELDPELTLSINYRARARNAKLARERGGSLGTCWRRAAASTGGRAGGSPMSRRSPTPPSPRTPRRT